MPYHTKTQLPDAVREHLPSHAQDIYKEAFNSALHHYGEEERAHRVAWAAVKRQYTRGSGGDWHHTYH